MISSYKIYYFNFWMLLTAITNMDKIKADKANAAIYCARYLYRMTLGNIESDAAQFIAHFFASIVELSKKFSRIMAMRKRTKLIEAIEALRCFINYAVD